MAKSSAFPFALAVLAASVSVLYSAPVTCTLATPPPPLVPSHGESELVEDIVLTCVSAGPSQSALVNISLFLSVNLTSRITNTSTLATEALLLIDDPMPGVANTSNGFPYFGQVLGMPGILAGAPGSGNVYQGMQVLGTGGVVLGNGVQWLGVPFVTGGTRTFRMTNIRANVSQVGVNPVNADVAINGAIATAITNPQITVANGAYALRVTSGPLIGAVGLDISFAELYPAAFKKRVENTIGGPLTIQYQDVPGTPYCTESGFTPEFVSLTPGAIGLADTGARLVAVLQSIPPGITTLIVPNQVTSLGGALVAHRVLPPFGSDLSKGTVLTAPGNSLAFVSAAHTAGLLYEVTAAAPYLGLNGCGALDTFSISVIPTVPMSMSSTTVWGDWAPLDYVGTASATAPEPRFIP